MNCKQALVLCITVAPMLAVAEELRFQVTNANNNQPLGNAVIVLPLPADDAVTDARMVQKNRQFDPHVLVVPTGTDVAFPNQDNTQHHVYSFSPAKRFEIELYAGVPEAPVNFGTTGVVELGCNIHDQMQAFIVVNDQHYGVTADSGELALSWPDERPLPGQIRVWHPRLADNTALMDMAVDVDGDRPVSLSLDVRPESETDSSLERLQQRFREL